MAGQPSDIPLGVCVTCHMPLISQEGIRICPSCDTKSVKSGLVNKYEDPGKNMDKEGKISGGIKTMDNIQAGVAQVNSLEQKSIPSDPLDLISYHISSLDGVLSNMKLSDFSDLREARKVMKFRKKLAVLKVELQDLVG